jgi:flagellin-like protein
VIGVKALRKGVSPVIATLLLILIAVAAAVLLYTWVSSLSANVAGSKVAGKTLSLIQATWATSYMSAPNYGQQQMVFDKGIVLIASFQAPPSVVKGGQQAGYATITIDNVNVLFNGKVICGYNQIAASIDDSFHIGRTMGTRNVEDLATGAFTASSTKVAGVVVAGYGGLNLSTRDSSTSDVDALVPGLVLFTTSDAPGNAAYGKAQYAGNATINGVENAVYGNVSTAYFYPAKDSFVTVIAGTYETNYVATDYVETNFKPSGAKIVYDKWMSNYVNVAEDGNGNNYQADLYDLVKVSQGAWTVVAYCPNVNINTMSSATLQIQFADGSTWEQSIPLTVQ